MMKRHWQDRIVFLKDTFELFIRVHSVNADKSSSVFESSTPKVVSVTWYCIVIIGIQPNHMESPVLVSVQYNLSNKQQRAAKVKK